MTSLDPRVNRLPGITDPAKPKEQLDQLGTFEVFVQPKTGKPFQHEGIVHAPDPEMAYVLAKETFTRRFTCVSLYVVETVNVNVSVTTEGSISAYDQLGELPLQDNSKQSYEIYHLPRRGKQHVHFGTVHAATPREAMIIAGKNLEPGKTVCNIWAVLTDRIRFTAPEENDLWTTLPEKKFRDAAEYKGGDKLKQFLETRNQ